MEVSCLHCAKTFSIDKPHSVKAGDENSELVRNGELFKWTCPLCGRESVLNFPLLYHDEEAGILLLLSQNAVSAEAVPEGYKARVVSSPGDLVEKIKIFETGLDDVVMEVCKYVTLSELNKELSLKFFRIDGADSQLSFTYPEAGQMQILTIGLNVYEDCAAIVQRNPSILQAAKGLIRVDQDWIARFFG